MSKTCSKCGLQKDRLNFSRCRAARDGFMRWCKSCCAEYASVWWDKNKVRLANKKREASSRYRKNNVVKVNRASAKYISARRKNDPKFRMLLSLRKRRWEALRGTKKNRSTREELGCSLNFFVSYLETAFQPGMTWENYGIVWEIDHIRPCASFDLVNTAQQKECFHWSNCQPMFVSDNRSKGKKYVG